MPVRYYKWIFVGSLTAADGKSPAELLQPLEDICEHSGEGYAFNLSIRFSGNPRRVIFNIPEPVYGAGLQEAKKFTRRYIVANERGNISLVEHDLRLSSRTRSTTVVSKVGYGHAQLLKALDQFYRREEKYHLLHPEIPQPFIIVDNS